MDARETTFGTLFNGRVQFRVPLFQRQYAWERAHREQLWTDVLDLNHPSMHTLIDGQQRLTTLSILLAALRDHLTANGDDSADRIDALYLQNQCPQEPADATPSFIMNRLRIRSTCRRLRPVVLRLSNTR